jgi:RNA polymerase sigma-70 factor (ECF subfamily)
MIDNDGAPIRQRKIPRELVRRALADLPGHQRALLMLICVDGMTYKQAAELLGIAISTVAARVATARQTLSKQIAVRSGPDAGRSISEAELVHADAEGGGHSC